MDPATFELLRDIASGIVSVSYTPPTLPTTHAFYI
mgnify:CR=1 FL=1